MSSISSTSHRIKSIASLDDVPNEVFVLSILPRLEARDVLHLGQTQKRFQSLVKDQQLWQKLLQRDHKKAPSFLLDPKAQTLPAQAIYRGLYASRAFRLSPDVAKASFSESGNDDSPVTLPLSGKKGLEELSLPRTDGEGVERNVFVEIYHCQPNTIARTAQGDIYLLTSSKRSILPPVMWAVRRESQPFARSRKVHLPFKIAKIALAREAATLTDEEGQVWMLFFDNECLVYKHTSPILQSPTRILDVTASMDVSEFLTDDGNIVESSYMDGELSDGDGLTLYHSGMTRGKDCKQGTFDAYFCEHIEHIPPHNPVGQINLTGELEPLAQAWMDTPKDPMRAVTGHQIVSIATCTSGTIALKKNGQVWRFHINEDTDALEWSFIHGVSDPDVTMIRISHDSGPMYGDTLAVTGSPQGPIRCATLLDDDDEMVYDEEHGEYVAEDVVPERTTMYLDGKTVVDFCSDATNVYALLSTGELYMWPCMLQIITHFRCHLLEDATRVIVGKEDLFVYAISSVGPGLSILAMERSAGKEHRGGKAKGKGKQKAAAR